MTQDQVPILQAPTEHLSDGWWQGASDIVHLYPVDIVVLIVILGLIIAVTRIFYSGRMSDYMRASVLPDWIWKNRTNVDWGLEVPDLLLDVVAIGGYSLFVMVLFFQVSLASFGMAFFYIFLIYILKQVWSGCMGTVFFGTAHGVWHVKQTMISVRSSGLVMVPVMFLAMYQSRIGISEVLDVVVIGLIIWHLARMCIMLWGLRREIMGMGIYVFLYFCIAEIAPMALVMRNMLLSPEE